MSNRDKWEKRNKCPLIVFLLSWLQHVFNNLFSCFQHLVLGYHSKCHPLKPARSKAVLARSLHPLQPFPLPLCCVSSPESFSPSQSQGLITSPEAPIPSRVRPHVSLTFNQVTSPTSSTYFISKCRAFIALRRIQPLD